VKLVWYVHPKTRTVEVYAAVDRLVTLTEADALSGGDVLPGFALPVADLFSADRFGAGPGPAA
jgi:Uma2 family endonuclease